MGDGASVQRMRRWGRLLLPLASALAVAAVAAVVAVLTMPHHDTTDAAGQKQLAVGGFTFHYPATWHKIKAGDHKHPAEAAVPSVFLASMPMRGNCARTSDGIACGDWPPGRLANGGLVASFANHYGQPEARRDTVAGRPASIKRGSPSVECLNVGGEYELVAELVAVSAPMSGQDDEFVQVDACLAGATRDHDQALAAIDHMLATATFHG
ncbi:MAG TPA: hypothetical protein VGJ59_07885 [Jatrophihabitantaceae bacterium]